MTTEFTVDIESVDDDEFVIDMDGIPGPKGDKGDPGGTGATPEFSVGTVETLSPGSSATATITGTAERPVLNLGIPEGGAVFS